MNENCEAPGKHPRVKWKVYQDRLPTEDEVRTWWRRWPDSNIAILTGAISGLVVVDIDPRHGGDESLLDLGPLPDTLTATTGGGGQHLYWQHPGYPVPNAAGIRHGIDVRGDGGYVLAPPSGHRSGGVYAWDDAQPSEPAPLPHVVLTAMGNRPIGNGAPSSRTFDLEAILARGIPEGERDNTLTQVTGHYATQGASYDMLLMTMRGVNATYCQPAVSDAEVVRIVDSIWRRQEAKSRVAVAVAERLNGHNGDASDITSPDDRRAMARQVWDEDGVPGVVDWIIVRSEPVAYVLVTAEDEARLGDDLLNQNSVRKHLLNQISGQLRVFERTEWMKHAKILRDLAREEIPEPTQAAHRVEEWLDAWAEAKPPAQPEPEGRQLALRNRLITTEDGRRWLRPQALAKWLRGEGEEVPLKDVRAMLRRAGWRTSTMNAGEGKGVRAWWS